MHSGRRSSIDPACLVPPDSPLARDAQAAAQDLLTPVLLNHSGRAYTWGVAIAALHGIRFDRELLYLTAMLVPAPLRHERPEHSATLPRPPDGSRLGIVERPPRRSGRLRSGYRNRYTRSKESSPNGTLREHKRGQARTRAVTRFLRIPSVCGIVVVAVTRACPWFPLQTSMARRVSTVRVRQRASHDARRWTSRRRHHTRSARPGSPNRLLGSTSRPRMSRR
jgi:hypothetical protein